MLKEKNPRAYAAGWVTAALISSTHLLSISPGGLTCAARTQALPPYNHLFDIPFSETLTSSSVTFIAGI